MSKMVSARVPDALYEQGALQLSTLGSSTSELINAAFEYLLQEHRLPTPPHSVISSKRRLPPEQAQRLKELLDACTLDVDVPSDIAYDKQAIREARSAKYETLT